MRNLLIASSCIFAALAIGAQAQDLGGKEDALNPPPDLSVNAPTPAAADTTATISSTPATVFKAKVGAYPMSHYASPSRPIPYDQLDAYLKAPRSQQMAKNWWTGTELAETATSSNVSTTVSNSTAGIPGDTDVSLKADTQAPISDVQRQLNASGLSGTPTPSGQTTAPPDDALTPAPEPTQ